MIMSCKCRHRSLEIISADVNVNHTVRCISCKEVMASWSNEHLQERFDTMFGFDNLFTNSIPKEETFLRELTDCEREELR